MADRARSRVFSLPRDALVVTGADRQSWLDGLVTCDVPKAAGMAAYGFLLTKQGKIVSDLFVLESGAELVIGTAPGSGAALHELLDRYLVMEDAELSRATSRFFYVIEGSVEELPPELGSPATLSGLGADLWLAVTTAAFEAAEPYEALRARLAARGIGAFGIDFGDRDNPHEAGLERLAVSWKKGCYLGQEVVCMQDMRGKVKRRVVALRAPAGAAGRADAVGAPLTAPDSGKVVGHVTSAFELEDAVLLLGAVDAPEFEPGRELRFGATAARVVAPAPVGVD